jgi:hypothetical protein
MQPYDVGFDFWVGNLGAKESTEITEITEIPFLEYKTGLPHPTFLSALEGSGQRKSRCRPESKCLHGFYQQPDAS